MTDVIVTEFMDEKALAPLHARYQVVFDPTLADNSNRLMALVPEARALIVRNRTEVRGPLLDRAERLECVGRLGVGLDNIDLETCKTRGITVYPAFGANDVSVAEYVVTTALVLLRGAYFSSADVASGTWPRNRLMGREAAGKQIGLIGFGAIARAVAVRAAALGMAIAAYDPYLAADDDAFRHVDHQSLETLLHTSDVISLHVPLTEETRHMIDAHALTTMKSGAILINAARGGVVDEAAVIDRLNSGHLGGAALDVFEIEPVTAESGARFAGVPNLILTPHIGGITQEANTRVSTVTAQAVLDHLDRSA